MQFFPHSSHDELENYVYLPPTRFIPFGGTQSQTYEHVTFSFAGMWFNFDLSILSCVLKRFDWRSYTLLTVSVSLIIWLSFQELTLCDDLIMWLFQSLLLFEIHFIICFEFPLYSFTFTWVSYTNLFWSHIPTYIIRVDWFYVIIVNCLDFRFKSSDQECPWLIQHRLRRYRAGHVRRQAISWMWVLMHFNCPFFDWVVVVTDLRPALETLPILSEQSACLLSWRVYLSGSQHALPACEIVCTTLCELYAPT